MNIPPAYVLALSGILFALGVVGVLIRRNAIVIFMSKYLVRHFIPLLYFIWPSRMNVLRIQQGKPKILFTQILR